MHFVNSLMNQILSSMLGVEDFLSKVDLHSIIEKMDLFDVKMFKSHCVDNERIGLSIDEQSEREIENISNEKSAKNSEMFEVKTHSLRDIFLSSSKELDGLQFCFDSNDTVGLRKKLRNAIKEVYNDDIFSMPRFNDFRIRKIPLDDEKSEENSYPSFILQFKDLSMNTKASAHEKTSNKVYKAINNSIAHKVHGPLGCIVNQSKIFQIMVE